MICPKDQLPCQGYNTLECSAACLQQVMHPPVTEAMRLEAINNLMKWQTQDPTTKVLVRAVLKGMAQPSIGHLARFCPDAFDDLYEEASALVRNDL